MNFGLGLVLSFTDNASAGINQAVNSLSQLTNEASKVSSTLDSLALEAFSNITSQLGSAMSGFGRGIINTFVSSAQDIIGVGQTLKYANNQMIALYGSEELASQEMARLTDYAKTSMFEFEQMIGIVTMLKSVGIEAFDKIATSSGNTTATLMDYASALAAFNPNMRNMYGTGLQAAMGALKEYVAEGNKRSLLTGAGLDITQILGEDKGATIEERSRQVADLIEQLGMLGMVGLISDDPKTKLSNIGDTIFQLKGLMSDSGLYNAYVRLVDVLDNFVTSIPEEQLQALATTIGGALSELIEPLITVAQKVADFTRSLIDLFLENPKMAEFAVKAVALVGALSVLGGAFLTTLSILGRVSNGIMLFSKLFGSIPKVISAGVGTIAKSLLPLTLIIGTILFVWKTDLFGIRTVVTEFVSNVVSAFQTARNLINGDLTSLQNALAEYRTRDDFFSGLTVAIMQVMTLFTALAEAWNGNTLSEDTYLKAKELGILPLIEAILDLKYRFGLFVDGFQQGLENVRQKGLEVFGLIQEKVKGTIFEDLLNSVTAFFQELASGDADAWFRFGESFAEFCALSVAFAGVLAIARKVSVVFGGIVKGVTLVTSLITKLGAVIGAVATFFGNLGAGLALFFEQPLAFIYAFFPALGKAIENIGLAFHFPLQALQAFGEWLVSALTPVVAVLSVIIGAITAVVNFIDQMKNGFNAIKTILMYIGIALVAVGAVLLGAVTAPVAAVVALIVGAVATIAILVKQYWEQIKNGFLTAVNWIYSNVISPVVNFFMTYIYPIFEKIIEIVAKLVEIVVALLVALAIAIRDNVIEPIKNFFVGCFEWLGEKWTAFVEGIKTIFLPIVEWINTNIISPIQEFFSGLWEGIQFAFEAVADTISQVLSSAVNTVLNFICGVINTVIRGINSAIDVINAIPNVNVSRITELSVPQLATGGVVTSPTNAIIGEAGAEAVVPLERNTGWLDKMSTMLVDGMRRANSSDYLTRGNGVTNNNTSTDNSVTFNSGAINLVANNSSDEEAERLANKIIEIIKRKTELDSMLCYN